MNENTDPPRNPLNRPVAKAAFVAAVIILIVVIIAV